MHLSCARAVELGLPAVAFTEHVDFTPFRAGYLRETFPELVNDAGILVAPEFDAEGYFDCIEECRSNYPDLTILTGLEVGQPHRHREQLAELLGRGEFQRVLGSLHCLRDGDSFAEPSSCSLATTRLRSFGTIWRRFHGWSLTTRFSKLSAISTM
jgi:histidinol-phosphatase (PHP family)